MAIGSINGAVSRPQSIPQPEGVKIQSRRVPKEESSESANGKTAEANPQAASDKLTGKGQVLNTEA